MAENEQKKECFVCGTSAYFQYDHDRDMAFYACPVCGRYELGFSIVNRGMNKNQLASFLLYNGFRASDFEYRYYTSLKKEVCDQYKDYFTSIASSITPEELERFIILAESLKGFDITDKLSCIKCPVLILGAFDDTVLDSDMTMEIAEKLEETTDIKLFVYNGYGHAVYDTAPDYKKRIAEWLNGDKKP